MNPYITEVKTSISHLVQKPLGDNKSHPIKQIRKSQGEQIDQKGSLFLLTIPS